MLALIDPVQLIDESFVFLVCYRGITRLSIPSDTLISYGSLASVALFFDEINDFIFGITGLYTEKSEVFRNLPPVECSICGDILDTELPFL